MSTEVERLRRIVQESIRVQRSGSGTIEYVDVTRALADMVAKQNHVVFGRRGCGKTLLMQTTQEKVDESVRVVYINCEDYKQHSFPNVLIEILDNLFEELEKNLRGWFGRKRRSRQLISEIRTDLAQLKEGADEADRTIRKTDSAELSTKASVGLAAEGLGVGATEASERKAALEQEYKQHDSKIQRLNLLLPKLKGRIREFFEISAEVKSVFLELDDFYHLPRTMQPHVADYVHRLCKDVPLYFKFATLRHASMLFADRGNQPTGAQERHDYQPINVDFTLADFKKTADQLREILYRYGEKAGMDRGQIDALFMGEGFDRLVLASGGVPRDFLSLLLEALSPKAPGEEKIGKDDVRILSLTVLQRRIEELKVDSEQQDQDALIRGIYAIRKFCLDKKANVFLLADRVLQEPNGIRDLINRLLDYRIIHSVGSALTHKSIPGTFNAYMIDIGAYANLRKLEGRFNEIDVTAPDAKERCRNAPVLDDHTLMGLYQAAPAKVETALLEEVAVDAG
jgi:AAA domain-containing protein